MTVTTPALRHSAAQPPAPAPGPRTWTVTTDTGFSISGHLPHWAADDPSEDQVPVDRLGIALSDINHHQDVRAFPLPLLAPGHPGNAGQPTHPAPVFRAGIDCDPYAPEPELRVPVLNLHLVDDHRIEALGPDGITELAAALRAHADILETHVHQALTAARCDWARHNTNGHA